MILNQYFVVIAIAKPNWALKSKSKSKQRAKQNKTIIVRHNTQTDNIFMISKLRLKLQINIDLIWILTIEGSMRYYDWIPIYIIIVFEAIFTYEIVSDVNGIC